MSEIKLKPCPFCGGVASIDSEEGWFGLGYFVMCLKCMNRTAHYMYSMNASDAWNTRVSEKDKEGDDTNGKADNHC